MNAATVFSFLVFIIIAGWLWFYIGRPILEDFGIIGGEIVNDNAPAPAHVMSRSEESAPTSLRLSKETAIQTDRQTEGEARIKSEQFLTVYRLMREAGIGREAAAAAFKAGDLPFNNNVWRDAEPAPRAAPVEDDEIVTPYAGRRTRASYYPEQPELEYRSPAM